MISPQKHGKFRHREPGYVRCSQSPALGSVSPMARDISKLLELAEERVARSERFLRTQRELIETLRRLGYETAGPAARIRRLTHAIHRCPGSASRGAGAKRCGTANSFGVCVTTSTARIKIEQHPAASPHLISTARATTPPGSPQSAGRLSVGLSQAVPLARYRRYRRSSARRCGAATCSSLPSRAEVPPARPTPRRVLFEQQHCYRCRAA